MAGRTSVKARGVALRRKAKAEVESPVSGRNGSSSGASAAPQVAVGFSQSEYRALEGWIVDEDDLILDDYIEIPSPYPSETVTMRFIQGGYRSVDLMEE